MGFPADDGTMGRAFTNAAWVGVPSVSADGTGSCSRAGHFSAEAPARGDSLPALFLFSGGFDALGAN